MFRRRFRATYCPETPYIEFCSTRSAENIANEYGEREMENYLRTRENGATNGAWMR